MVSYNTLFKKNTLILIIIIFIALIIRIPVLFLDSSVWDDPDGDTGQYYLYAHNILQGNGMTVEYKPFVYRPDLNNYSHVIRNHNPIPPLYPLTLVPGLYLFDSQMTLALQQIVFFVILILIMYYLLISLFDRKVVLWSLLLFVLIPELHEVSIKGATEILFILLMISSFKLLLLFEKNRSTWLIISISLASTLTIYTRYYGIMVAGTIFIYFLIHKRFNEMLRFSILTIIFMFPFFAIKFYYLGSNWIYFYDIVNLRDIIYTEGAFEEISRAKRGYIGQLSNVIVGNATHLTSSKVLFFLTPFCFLGLIKDFKINKLALLTVIFLVLFILFHGVMLTVAVARYFLPNAVLLIPFGVAYLITSTSLMFKKYSYLLTTLFFIVLSMFFLHQIAKHYEGLFNYVFTDDRNHSWYDEQPVGTIATTNIIPHRANFITGNPSVNFSERLGYDGLNLFIKRYDVNYLHIDYFEPGFNLFVDNEGEPIKKIELRDYKLILEKIYDEGYGGRDLVIIYSVNNLYRDTMHETQ